MNAKRVARCAVLAACAILLGWVERLVPFSSVIPGVKPGLANGAVLLTLYSGKDGEAESFFVMLIKVIVTGLLFSGVTGFLYSMTGSMLSWLLMILLKRTKIFSIYGISVAGAAAHVSGQMLCAMWLLSAGGLLWYWAVLLFFAVPSGLLVAFLCARIYQRIIS